MYGLRWGHRGRRENTGVREKSKVWSNQGAIGKSPTPIPLEPDILQISATFKKIESRHCSNREKDLVVL